MDNKRIQELQEKMQKEYWIVKSNEIIQKCRFELSLPEQKTIAYICSLIKPGSTELNYEFQIRDYCKLCGIDYNAGKNYQNVKATLKGLRDKSFWLKMPDNSEITISWIAKVSCNKKSGLIKIKIDEDMIPYLFNLKERFTQYQLYNILNMRSAFSIRLYELLKSFAFCGKYEVELEELKKILMVEDVKSYERFPDFRRKVIEIAIREINDLTDLLIKYETIKKGKKVTAIQFKIKSKDPIQWMLCRREKENKE